MSGASRDSPLCTATLVSSSPFWASANERRQVCAHRDETLADGNASRLEGHLLAYPPKIVLDDAVIVSRILALQTFRFLLQ